MSSLKEPTFRLLDARVGWDEDPRSTQGLVGFDDERGLSLAPLNPAEVSEADTLPWFTPPWIARGVLPCEWLLAAPSHRQLQRVRPGEAAFSPWGPELASVDAVATDTRTFIAVADRSAERVVVLDGLGRARARFAIVGASVLAFAPWPELLVATNGRVERFSLAGERRQPLETHFAQILALRVDHENTIWVVHRDAGGALGLARFDRQGHPLPLQGVTSFEGLLGPTGIRLWRDAGLCWSDAGGPVSPCIARDGTPVDGRLLEPFGRRRYRSGGTLTVRPLDSEAQRTVWHRVRVDADVPSGTSLRVEVSTLDGPAGTPTWRTSTSLDFLCQLPPGQYLGLRLTLLNGDEPTASPRVRQIRVDYPRATSADLLPEVYREDPRAADFTERFLSMFDAELQRLDDAIERFPATLSVDRAPPESLPWLAGFLGTSFGSGWTEERQRAFLHAVPLLYRSRGTPRGLADTLTIAAGLAKAPAISENPSALGAIGKSFRLNANRLFGRSRRRFRLDTSTLGSAPLRSYGNPDTDPAMERAFRFTIQFPADASASQQDRMRLEALVDALKPAHTVAQVRFGSRGFIVGWASAVGIDTALVPLPAPVLGQTPRLSRRSVLWPSAASRHPAWPLTWPIVGLTTSLGRSA